MKNSTRTEDPLICQIEKNWENKYIKEISSHQLEIKDLELVTKEIDVSISSLLETQEKQVSKRDKLFLFKREFCQNTCPAFVEDLKKTLEQHEIAVDSLKRMEDIYESSTILSQKAHATVIIGELVDELSTIDVKIEYLMAYKVELEQEELALDNKISTSAQQLDRTLSLIKDQNILRSKTQKRLIFLKSDLIVLSNRFILYKGEL